MPSEVSGSHRKPATRPAAESAPNVWTQVLPTEAAASTTLAAHALAQRHGFEQRPQSWTVLDELTCALGRRRCPAAVPGVSRPRSEPRSRYPAVPPAKPPRPQACLHPASGKKRAQNARSGYHSRPHHMAEVAANVTPSSRQGLELGKRVEAGSACSVRRASNALEGFEEGLDRADRFGRGSPDPDLNPHPKADPDLDPDPYLTYDNPNPTCTAPSRPAHSRCRPLTRSRASESSSCSAPTLRRAAWTSVLCSVCGRTATGR